LHFVFLVCIKAQGFTNNYSVFVFLNFNCAVEEYIYVHLEFALYKRLSFKNCILEQEIISKETVLEAKVYFYRNFWKGVQLILNISAHLNKALQRGWIKECGQP
jgi:hypothetical protein